MSAGDLGEVGTEPGDPMTLLGHLDELRSRLFKSAIALVVCVIVAFFFTDQIFDLLVHPWNRVADGEQLAYFRPGEAFTFYMRLALFGGIVLASPYLIWQAWAFVSPALHRREKRFVVPALLTMSLLFLAGLAIGYWSLSRGLEFLLGFGEGRLDPTIGSELYLSFAMRFLLVFAVAFLFPVFLFAAAAVGTVSSRALRKGRRWAIMIILVVGAVVTPSGDPVTLLLLSIPLYLLYEATIWLVKWILKR